MAFYLAYKYLQPRSTSRTRLKWERPIIGLAITPYIRYVYGNFGREIIKYTFIYGVYICPNPNCEERLLWSVFLNPSRFNSPVNVSQVNDG